jgi:hypothetical protein
MGKGLDTPGTKPTNPKDIIGSDKLPLHLWPTAATALGCLAMEEGLLKYGRSNWREMGIRPTIYVDACKRHLDAWMECEEYAPDTGTPHLSSALACLAIIVDAIANEKLVDDRNYVPNPGSWRRFIDTYCAPHVPRLKQMFLDKAPKHYTAKDNTGPQESEPAYRVRAGFDYKAPKSVRGPIHHTPVEEREQS